MTIYEKTKVIALRAQMLANGSMSFINIPKNITSVIDIATLELKQRKIPFIIKRRIPNNTYEYWRINEMVIND